MNCKTARGTSLTKKITQTLLILLTFWAFQLNAQTFNKTYPDGANFTGFFATETTNSFTINARNDNDKSQLDIDFSGTQTAYNSGQEFCEGPGGFDPIFKVSETEFLLGSFNEDIQAAVLTKMEYENGCANAPTTLFTEFLHFPADDDITVTSVRGSTAGEFFIAGIKRISNSPPFQFQYWVIKVGVANTELWRYFTPVLELNMPPVIPLIVLTPASGEVYLRYGSTTSTPQNLIHIDADGNEVYNSNIGGFLALLSDFQKRANGELLMKKYIASLSGPGDTDNVERIGTDGNVVAAYRPSISLGDFFDTFVYLPRVDAFTETNDGGLIITGVTEGIGPEGFYIIKYNIDGTVQWIQFEDDYFPNPEFITQTSDNGYLITGSNNDELWVLKTDTNGNYGGENEEDIDLKLTQVSTNPNPAQYSIFSLTTTITNSGDEAATNVEVEIPINDIQDLIYTGGNEFNASQGTFSSFGSEIWVVGSLAVGGSATITTNYFVLGTNDYAIFSQVVNADQTDSDSSPNNGTPPIPNEDDEVVFGEVSGCQFTVSIVEIQCQPNQTLDDPSDDIFTAKIEVVSNSDCVGNFLIDGNFGGIFDNEPVEWSLSSYPIVDGDVTISVTNGNGSVEVLVVLEAPETCSDGANPDECGFENTYDNIPADFSNLRYQTAIETDSNYTLELYGNAIGVPFQYYDLEVGFAGEELVNSISGTVTGTIDRSSDGGFYGVEGGENNEVTFTKLDADGNEIWSNTQAFNSGGPQGEPTVTDVIELPDGQAYLVRVFGPMDWMWILKLDLNGDLVYNNFLTNPNGFNELYFHGLAQNGDFLVYRHSGARIGILTRISTEGALIYESNVVGDLVTSRFGGFAETFDGDFIYASYRDQLIPHLAKFDAYTGDQIWERNLNNVFTPDAPFKFAIDGFDVVATLDGGAVVGHAYNPGPPFNTESGYEYGRLTGQGLLVWRHELPEGYILEAELATSDGGFIFAGAINGEYGLIKTTSQGLITPACIEDNGECAISATAINVFCDDQGSPDNPLDDKFGFDILVTGNNTGASFSVTENGLGQMTGGQYDIAFTYPELFFIQDVVSFSVVDSDSSSCITSLIITPPAPCSDSMNGVDLELSLETNEINVSPWTLLPVEVVITNAGNENATGIIIDISQPAGVNFAGGNEFSTTQGTYNPYGNQQWIVGGLAAGESATLTINYFILGANNPLEIYAQVIAQNELDIDSESNNGTSPIVNEDDEDFLFILPMGANFIGNSTGINQGASFQEGTKSIDFQLVSLYPNPVADHLNLEIGTATDGIAQINIMNLQGRTVQFSEQELQQGLNKISMDVSRLPKGIHFVFVQKGESREILRFVRQ